jgi:hypothetical protein
MAARHANFALVACVTEDLANSLLEQAFSRIPPLSFRWPSPVSVGSRQVVLGGEFSILPPSVSITRRADNLVEVSWRVISDLRLEGLTTEPVDVLVELGGTLLTAVAAPIENDRVQVVLDLARTSVTHMHLKVVEGSLGPGALGGGYGAAINSQAVKDALTRALRSLPPSLVRLLPNGFPATTRMAPVRMPCGMSVFNPPTMYEASYTISRVVPVTRDGTLVVGVDVAGHTLGEPAHLETLAGHAATVWMTTTSEQHDGRIYSAATVRGRGGLMVSVNPDFVRSLLDRTISPAVHDRFIDCHIAFDRISISFETFTPRLTANRIEGAVLKIGVRRYSRPGRDAEGRLTPGGHSVRADVTAKIAMHLQAFDGSTTWLCRQNRPYWYVKVYDVDIDVPHWVSFGLVLAGIFVPGMALPVFTVLDGILPSFLANFEEEVRRTAQSGISEEFSSLPLESVGNVRLVTFNKDGLDVYADLVVPRREAPRPDRDLVVMAGDSRLSHGGTVYRSYKEKKPVWCSADLKEGIVNPRDPSIRISWEVRRSDTGETYASLDAPYRSAFSRVLKIDPGTPELSVVDVFEVSVRVYRPLHGRVKEFGSCKFSVSVQDYVDRHHPYVQWRPWFSYGKRQSVIHRTSADGRCSMILRAVNSRARKGKKMDFEYLDELPFPVSEIRDHRREVCDYCFFGTPQSEVPRVA